MRGWQSNCEIVTVGKSVQNFGDRIASSLVRFQKQDVFECVTVPKSKTTLWVIFDILSKNEKTCSFVSSQQELIFTCDQFHHLSNNVIKVAILSRSIRFKTVAIYMFTRYFLIQASLPKLC